VIGYNMRLLSIQKTLNSRVFLCSGNMGDYERYQAPDKDGRCPHGIYLSNATCAKCYHNKKCYKEASKSILERAKNLGW